MSILVTGCAGFIGFNLCQNYLKSHSDLKKIYGIDNLNSYYDVNLKKNRIKILKKHSNFIFKKIDIKDKNKLSRFVQDNSIKIIIHLAAQAGVRYSISHPKSYVDSNIIGFFNILEVSRENKIKHLIFASTSSVYGYSDKFPLSENDNTDKPVSFYAATKKSNEVMAYSYSSLYKIPCTGIRFFTVYGPYGRPDMALFKFTKSIIEDKKIELFNDGKHVRDFTYIDDVSNSIIKLITKIPSYKIPYNIYNIGNSKPEKLKSFLNEIEKNLGKKSRIISKKLQKGDVYKTHANIDKLVKRIDFKPVVKIKTGIKKFIEWYIDYYKIK